MAAMVVAGACQMTVAQSDLHVAVSGSDSSGDGNLDNPFKTIQHGIDAADLDGVIYVHPGSYTENLTIKKSLSLVSVEGPFKTTVRSKAKDTVFFIDTNNFLTVHQY